MRKGPTMTKYADGCPTHTIHGTKIESKCSKSQLGSKFLQGFSHRVNVCLTVLMHSFK